MNDVNKNDNTAEPIELEAEKLLIEKARHYCLSVANQYWEHIRAKTKVRWQIRKYTSVQTEISSEYLEQVSATTIRLCNLEPKYAGYELAIEYMNSLPKSYRKKYGIFYTPIKVVEQMLQDAKHQNIDLKTARVIDTSSGGSAFLAPLCRSMRNEYQSDQAFVDDIAARLTGFEIDPFAAWLSQFHVDCELAVLAPRAKRPQPIVHHADALTMPEHFFGQYDYVIGNPPYGKVKLSGVLKERYGDVIYGKPNLYQLFYKLALLLAKGNGFVHMITPTSFISGRYFSALRSHIESQASAVSFSFFENRKNIFDGVQQELVISMFNKRLTRRKTAIKYISAKNNATLSIIDVGTTRLTKGRAWVLPKNQDGVNASKVFTSCQHQLSSIGFSTHTGYVVPHRSEDKLSNRQKMVSKPMIWSEAISECQFVPESAYKKGRFKWYNGDSIIGLITEPVILIKRTSSKEQQRRIHASLVSQSYINQHQGFYAENHVNVLKRKDEAPVSLTVILKLLNTRIVDDIFRCISGTVTVSSSELNQLPIPSPEALKIFAKNTQRTKKPELLEQAARIAYGV